MCHTMHGPTTYGLITGTCLWSHHDRRHLIMCIIDEHIRVSWQCWLRNHESSQTKGPSTSLRIHFAEVPFQDTYLDREPVDEEQRTRNYENLCAIRLIITEVDTHWWTCIWPCLTVRNTCPLLSLHLIILKYVSDSFKTEVVNNDNAAKFTGLSCKLHYICLLKMHTQ